MAAKTPDGYGRFTVSGNEPVVRVNAHRFAYELLVGPIPKGLTLDHLCRNRGCVNPAHLEPVTSKVNTLRSPIQVAATNARKTHCPEGHPLVEGNLIVWQFKRGKRSCLICKRRQMREYYYRRKGMLTDDDPGFCATDETTRV